MANNKGKTLVHVYQEDIYEPPADEVYPQLADGLAMMAIVPPVLKAEDQSPPLAEKLLGNGQATMLIVVSIYRVSLRHAPIVHICKGENNYSTRSNDACYAAFQGMRERVN